MYEVQILLKVLHEQLRMANGKYIDDQRSRKSIYGYPGKRDYNLQASLAREQY